MSHRKQLLGGSIFAAVCAALYLVFGVLVFGVLALILPVGMLLVLGARKCSEQRMQAKRDAVYATELPSVLLAMASLVKIGLPAHIALEKAVKIAAGESSLTRDLECFSRALEDGVAAEEAIQQFGENVHLPDLELFRRAFLLVLEHGGQFAPTLERLARFGRERGLLIESLRARTSGMRLTANCLFLLGPLIIIMLSAQIEGYWNTLLSHPVSRSLGLVGFVLVLAGYGALRRMAVLRV